MFLQNRTVQLFSQIFEEQELPCSVDHRLLNKKTPVKNTKIENYTILKKNDFEFLTSNLVCFILPSTWFETWYILLYQVRPIYTEVNKVQDLVLKNIPSKTNLYQDPLSTWLGILNYTKRQIENLV